MPGYVWNIMVAVIVCCGLAYLLRRSRRITRARLKQGPILPRAPISQATIDRVNNHVEFYYGGNRRD